MSKPIQHHYLPKNAYILSANTYGPYNGEEEVSHRDPKEILGEIGQWASKLEKHLKELNDIVL